MPLAPEEFEPSEELKKLIEEAKKERDKPLEEIIRESELEIKASREQAPADVAIARQLHQSEGMRKFKEQYGEAWKFIQKKSSEEKAVEAYYRMQELNEKKRPKTAEDYAAIDAYTGSMARAQGIGDSGGIDPIEVTKKTGADLVGMLGTALDFAQRAVVRAPGWRSVANSWEEAWKLSKNGWSDDLVVAGWPAFLAYPVGIALETATDPLAVSGVGIGIKTTAKEGAEQLAKMQARYGILGKNVDAQLGIYLRGLSGKRSLYGIPHTEKIAKLLKEKIGLTRMLTPEREPIGEILKTLNTGLGDKEAAQASYLVQKAFRPYGDQLVMLKMEPEAMARASIAMEYVGHVRKGEGWAAQEFDQITMGDQYVQTAAELIYDGKKRMQDVVSELGLRYPDLTDTIRARKAAEVESRLNAFEKQKSRKWADVREVERRGTATQEVLGQIVGRETAKRAQIGELIGKEAERIGEYGQQQLGEAVSQYSKIEGTASRATEYVPAQQEYMKVAQPSTPKMPGAGIERAVTAGAREEAQTLLTPHKRLVQNLSLAENVAKKPIIPPSMEALKSRLTSLKERGFDVKPELAFEAEKALDNARMLSGAIEKMQDMHPAELESLLKKSLTVGEYGQGLSPKTLGKGSKLIGELQGLMTARARLTKRAELLQQAVYKKIAVADAFSKMEKYDELLKRGAKFDQELAMSPAYSARISPTQRKGVAVASAEKEYIHHQKALSQSGAYQKRRFISEEGRSLYLNEMEKTFRGAIDDPKLLGEDLGEGIVEGSSKALEHKGLGDKELAEALDVGKSGYMGGNVGSKAGARSVFSKIRNAGVINEDEHELLKTFTDILPEWVWRSGDKRGIKLGIDVEAINAPEVIRDISKSANSVLGKYSNEGLLGSKYVEGKGWVTTGGTSDLITLTAARSPTAFLHELGHRTLAALLDEDSFNEVFEIWKKAKGPAFEAAKTATQKYSRGFAEWFSEGFRKYYLRKGEEAVGPILTRIYSKAASALEHLWGSIQQLFDKRPELINFLDKIHTGKGIVDKAEFAKGRLAKIRQYSPGAPELRLSESVANGKDLISRGYIRKALREMYNTPDLAKAVAMAKEEVGKGNFIMGRMFELNPILSLPVEFSRIAKDVRTDSIKKGLLLVASDVQDAAHSVPAKEFGGDIAKMYPDKFFPVELGNELKEWDNALAEMQKTDNWALRLYDGMQGMWKQQATGLWPAFQFRNMLSDFARATTKGVFNPISVLRDGSRAAIRSHGLIDLGHFGKISGQDLHDLASAHGILGGYSEEIASSLPKWSSRPMRIISSGEDIRRIGYFADRIRGGQAPIQAARDTLEVFFNYKNLAGWEKSVMKRIFPWWTFRRKNIGFQIDKLLSQPWWTAAESRILRTRGQADEDSPDWVPDRLRGSTGVLVREDGITNIMYGMDMGGIQDIVGMLDSTGHPEGAFKGFLDNAWQEISPILSLVPDIAKGSISVPGLSGIMSTGSDRELVDAPKGAENLPEIFREYLEIRQEPETLGSGFREAWKMPKGSLKVMRSLRLFSETMKFMRYENTKSVPKNFVDNLTNFLTGLSKREITKTQIEEMLLRERYLTLIEHAKEQGLYERGRLILRGQQSEFGQEFEYYQQAYYDAYRRRLAEDDARREPPGQ